MNFLDSYIFPSGLSILFLFENIRAMGLVPVKLYIQEAGMGLRFIDIF